MLERLNGARPVLTLGACAWTTIFRMPAWPRGSAKIIPHEALQLGDGMSASAACAVAALGAPVSWWGRVGDDFNGRAAIDSLSKAGVNCSAVRWDSTAKGSFCSVLVDEAGERLVVPRHDPSLNNDATWLPLHTLHDYSAVLTEVRWFEGARAILQAAREQGLPGVLDAEVSAPGELLQLCALASHILFSETGLAHCLGETVSAPEVHAALRTVLEGTQAVLVGVTFGERGFYWIERRQPSLLQHCAAPQITAVDTLGAGDVFHGVYTLALANGLSTPECAKLSVLAASLKCETFGGRLGTPNRAALATALGD
jgi:sulfofructose kinase